MSSCGRSLLDDWCTQAHADLALNLRRLNLRRGPYHILYTEFPMSYGQLVIGPPGSGKTTYCAGLQQYCKAIGRPCAVINLDPANDDPKYECNVDIKDLVTLENVQEELNLGPNGGLIFCMDYLEENIDWLQEHISELEKEDSYLIFDLPGQIELFTCHDSLVKVIRSMTEGWGLRLASVQLVDSHLCAEPTKYLSAMVVSLSTMLHLGLPHVNVLSKVDMLRQYGELDFQPSYFLRPNNLQHLSHSVQQHMHPKFGRATESLCDLLEDYGIVGFAPLAVEDTESMAYVVRLADKANGFAFSGAPTATITSMQGRVNILDTEDPEDIWERIEERANSQVSKP